MRITNNPDLTTTDTGYPAEPCWQKEGQPTLYYKRSSVQGAIRRAAKRLQKPTDEPMTREAPRLRGIRKGERTCKAGHIYHVPLHGKTTCPVCVQKGDAA